MIIATNPVPITAVSPLSRVATATGEQANYIQLRAWTEAVIAGKRPAPVMNCWARHFWNPAYYKTLLQASRLVLPTFQLLFDYSTTTWDTAPSSGGGYTSGCRELAELCNTQQLPICIRLGNAGLDLLNTASGVMELDYANSPLVQYQDMSGGTFKGYITPTGQDIPDDTSSYVVGDFYVTSAAGNLFTTNTKTTAIIDRVQAVVNSPSQSDGNDWINVPRYLGAFSPTAAWEALANNWDNGFLQRMGETMPNVPLVIYLINNEDFVEDIPWKDWRFDVQYPGVQQVFAPNPPGRTEYYCIMRNQFQARWKAFYDQMRSFQPWSNVKFTCYKSCGGHIKLGTRPQSGSADVKGWDPTGTAPYNVHGAQDTEYGLEWNQWDGGSAEHYLNNPQSVGGDCETRSNIFQLAWYPRITNGHARKKNATWFVGVSAYTSTAAITYNLANGHGYIDPERSKGVGRFLTFLHNPSLFSRYVAANTNQTSELIDAATRTTYGITEVHDEEDYFLADLALIEEIWNTDRLREALTWPLDLSPKVTLSFVEFQSEGPLAARSDLFLLPNTQFDPTSVTLGTATPTITICRRNGKGAGVILAWAPATGPLDTVVETADGPVSVTADQNGCFHYYNKAA